MKPGFFLIGLFSFLLTGPAFAQTKTIGVLPARIQKNLARGTRYALVIGVGKYQDPAIPRLAYTAADARAMYNVLTDPRHGRFSKENVKLLLDEEATAMNIRRGFTWIRRRARPEDMVVVYYSGHGAPEEGSTYWVPHNADINDLEATAVGNAYITRQLGKIRAKRLITFLDSCYSAAIVKKEDRPKALFNQDFFAKFKGAGRVTITASDGKELSLESKELGQGVFTYYLVQALKGRADVNGDGAVELEEVWAHVRGRVTDEAMKRGNRQRPQLIGSLSAGFLVSLNPSVLPRIRERLRKLANLLQAGRISGGQYEEAKKVLDGEGDARLLQVVRDLADGGLAPRYYRSARAEALRGREGPPAAPPPPKPRTAKREPENVAAGDLFIVSEPSGAQIAIDGRRIAGLTPNLAENLPAGKRRVVVRKGRTLGATVEVEVRAGELGNLSVKLGRLKGGLYVKVRPFGSEVFLDGRPLGKTPLKKTMNTGDYTLEVKRRGHRGFRERVSVDFGRVTEVSRALAAIPRGRLVVTSKPSGAEIYIGKKSRGKTPMVFELYEGMYHVTLKKEKYKPYSRKAVIRGNQKSTVVAVMAVEPIPRFIKGKDGAPIVLVPAGEFLMGLSEGDKAWLFSRCPDCGANIDSQGPRN